MLCLPREKCGVFSSPGFCCIIDELFSTSNATARLSFKSFILVLGLVREIIKVFRCLGGSLGTLDTLYVPRRRLKIIRISFVRLPTVQSARRDASSDHSAVSCLSWASRMHCLAKMRPSARGRGCLILSHGIIGHFSGESAFFDHLYLFGALNVSLRDQLSRPPQLLGSSRPLPATAYRGLRHDDETFRLICQSIVSQLKTSSVRLQL